MKKAVLVIIFFIIIFITTSFKTNPIFEKEDLTFNNPIVIDDHRLSYSVYGKIKGSGDIDFIKFQGKKGEDFFIQMTIPIININEKFYPSIALIGKGIHQKDKLPFNLPDGYGSIVIKSSEEKIEFFNEFTKTGYNIRQSLRGEVPLDGNYYIAVYSQKELGKYSLHIGENEKDSIIDKFNPITYFKVKYFLYPFKTIILSAIIILSIIMLTYLIKNRKRLLKSIETKITKFR